MIFSIHRSYYLSFIEHIRTTIGISIFTVRILLRRLNETLTKVQYIMFLRVTSNSRMKKIYNLEAI